MNLKKKLERYLPVNLLGPGPRLIKKGFTGPRSHKGSETLVYATPAVTEIMSVPYCWCLDTNMYMKKQTVNTLICITDT